MHGNCQTSAGLDLRGRTYPYRGLTGPRIYRLRASRCFRKELRRDILAFAARTASVLVGRCFGLGVFIAFPTVGIIGSTCVGLIELCSTGCVLMGPGPV